MLRYLLQQNLAHHYLNSILYKNGEPVFIKEQLNAGVRGPTDQFGYFMVGDPTFGIQYADTDDPMWGDGPFHIGYVNSVHIFNQETGDGYDTSSYVRRIPIRKWKQGLTAENTNIQGGRLSFAAALAHKGFHDMLQGKYPTFKQSVDLLGKRTRSVAFAPRWALGLSKLETVDLLYRGKLVGTGEDADSIKLGKRFKYLQESFKEAV